jgi:hypothetical protein
MSRAVVLSVVVERRIKEMRRAACIGDDAVADMVDLVKICGAEDGLALVPSMHGDGLEQTFAHCLVMFMCRRKSEGCFRHVLSHDQLNRILAALSENKALYDELDPIGRYMVDAYESAARIALSRAADRM